MDPKRCLPHGAPSRPGRPAAHVPAVPPRRSPVVPSHCVDDADCRRADENRLQLDARFLCVGGFGPAGGMRSPVLQPLWTLERPVLFFSGKARTFIGNATSGMAGVQGFANNLGAFRVRPRRVRHCRPNEGSSMWNRVLGHATGCPRGIQTTEHRKDAAVLHLGTVQPFRVGPSHGESIRRKGTREGDPASLPAGSHPEEQPKTPTTWARPRALRHGTDGYRSSH